jgi:hypothetical protein
LLLQRRIQRQTNVVDGQVHTSTRAQNQSENAAEVSTSHENITPATAAPVSQDPIAALVDSTKSVTVEDTSTGLAAAIARSKTVKQELEKTTLDNQQDKPVRKI